MVLSKQRKVRLDWQEFLWFGSPTALFAFQNKLFQKKVIYSIPYDRIVQRAFGTAVWDVPSVVYRATKNKQNKADALGFVQTFLFLRRFVFLLLSSLQFFV